MTSIQLRRLRRFAWRLARRAVRHAEGQAAGCRWTCARAMPPPVMGTAVRIALLGESSLPRFLSLLGMSVPSGCLHAFCPALHRCSPVGSGTPSASFAACACRPGMPALLARAPTRGACAHTCIHAFHRASNALSSSARQKAHGHMRKLTVCFRSQATQHPLCSLPGILAPPLLSAALRLQ